MRFQDKVCLVTGATSGIGRATAVQLGREGGKVACLGRDEAAGAQVVARQAAKQFSCEPTSATTPSSWRPWRRPWPAGAASMCW